MRLSITAAFEASQAFVMGIASRLAPRFQALRALALSWRRPIGVTAVLAFCVGLVVSLKELGIGIQDINWMAMLTLAVVVFPLGLALAAINLQICARLLGRSIAFREAFTVSAVGSIAEILPIPGGAIVRGAALMRAGANIGQSTQIVTVTAILTLAMSTGFGAVPFISAGYSAGYALLGSSVVVGAACATMIARRGGIRFLAPLIAVRALNFALGVGRIVLGFVAVSLSVSPLSAAVFAMAGSIGTSVSIIPAGIGVSEGIAAGLAGLVHVAPAAAFLVMSFNRILGLGVSAAVAAVHAASLARKVAARDTSELSEAAKAARET